MRLVIAEDAVLLREGLVRLLEAEGHAVVAAVGDAPGLVDAVETHAPDLALVDVRMPPGHGDDGLRAAVELRRRRPDLAVLVLSQVVERRLATELVRDDAAGVGYLLKDRVADVGGFLDALERVAGGGTAFDPEVVQALLTRSERPLDGLTDREREVLRLMAEGRTNPSIAAALHLSVSAIEKHVNAVFGKLDLHLEASDVYHRRVLAVLRHLGAPHPPTGGFPATGA